MSNYGYMKGVQPRWLSRFLGHKQQTLTAAMLLLTIPIFTGNVLDLLISCGALLGLALSPDLDLSYTRLGILGKISLANEYTLLVKHRSTISHTPFLGTLIRVLVVLVPLAAVFAMFKIRVGWAVILRLFVGLAWADFWHIILDWVSSNIVPKRRKR